MKLLYLHQYFNTPDMAGSTRSYEMARRLVKSGHEVHVVTTWRDESCSRGWFTTVVDGINVHWLPIRYSNRMSYRRRVWAFLRFAGGATRKGVALKGDLVLATSTPLTIAVPGIVVSKLLRIPMVFEVRDLWPELPIALGAIRNPLLKKLALLLERLAYRCSAAVIALSPGMKEGVVRHGIPHSRVAVIPNACDLELFGSRPTAHTLRRRIPGIGSRPVVLYAGTFGVVNGVPYAAHIAAASRRSGSEICFVLIGDGMERDRLLVEAERLGVLNRNLFICPPVSKKEMPAVLAGADLCLSLFTNLREMWANSANKFFDALAAGKPVAVNYGGWQADLIRDEGVGVVLPPDDYEGAAAILRDFLADPARVQAAGAAARRLAEQRFDRDALAAQFEAVLGRALERKTPVSGAA